MFVVKIRNWHQESEKESRDEATHGGMEELYQNNVEAAESYFVLNPAADW